VLIGAQRGVHIEKSDWVNSFARPSGVCDWTVRSIVLWWRGAVVGVEISFDALRAL